MNSYKAVPLGESIGLAATLAFTSIITIMFMVAISHMAIIN